MSLSKIHQIQKQNASKYHQIKGFGVVLPYKVQMIMARGGIDRTTAEQILARQEKKGS